MIGARSASTRAARRLPHALAVVGAASLVAPATTWAHGIGGTNELPVPGWLGAWAATLIVVLSFIALGAMWRTARFADGPVERHLRIPGLGLVQVPLGAVGVLAFAGLVYAGLAGSQDPANNVLPTTVYVVFWVAVPVASAIVGDVFAPLNPWRAVGRAAGWAASRLGWRRDPLPYPSWLGSWPVLVGLVGFGWLELVYLDGDAPAVVARLALLYAGVQLLGMALFGEPEWTRRGDAFAVYFRAFAALAPLRWSRAGLARRAPVAGATQLDPLVFSAAVVTAMVGITSFDGFSRSGLFGAISEAVVPVLGDIGLGARLAPQVLGTVGYAFMLGLIWGLYRLACRPLDRRMGARRAGSAFAHTLVPIALAYVLAHYVGLLIFQGQEMVPLLSDPLGSGADYLGTADTVIDYTLITPQSLWVVQVAVLVLGHVAGLALAHDRALSEFGTGRQAARSQNPMLVVMVALTSLGLYLLSS